MSIVTFLILHVLITEVIKVVPLITCYITTAVSPDAWDTFYYICNSAISWEIKFPCQNTIGLITIISLQHCSRFMGKVYYQFYFYELTSFYLSLISLENNSYIFEWKMKDQKRLVVRHRDPGTKLHDIVTRDYHVLHLDYVA